jgi:hypothetical protein
MSDYKEKDNAGSAFPVKQKKNHNHADHSGKAMVDGKMYWINVWEKKDKNGNPWFSFSFNERMPMADSGGNSPKKTEGFRSSSPDDDLPPW